MINLSLKTTLKTFLEIMAMTINQYSQILHPNWAGTIPYLEKETERHLRKADQLWEKKRKIEDEQS